MVTGMLFLLPAFAQSPYQLDPGLYPNLTAEQQLQFRDTVRAEEGYWRAYPDFSEKGFEHEWILPKGEESEFDELPDELQDAAGVRGAYLRLQQMPAKQPYGALSIADYAFSQDDLTLAKLAVRDGLRLTPGQPTIQRMLASRLLTESDDPAVLDDIVIRLPSSSVDVLRDAYLEHLLGGFPWPQPPSGQESACPACAGSATGPIGGEIRPKTTGSSDVPLQPLAAGSTGRWGSSAGPQNALIVFEDVDWPRWLNGPLQAVIDAACRSYSPLRDVAPSLYFSTIESRASRDNPSAAFIIHNVLLNSEKEDVLKYANSKITVSVNQQTHSIEVISGELLFGTATPEVLALWAPLWQSIRGRPWVVEGHGWQGPNTDKQLSVVICESILRTVGAPPSGCT
jgi:hypothetical protein